MHYQANARSLNLGWGWAESTGSTVSHMTQTVSKTPEMNSKKEELIRNAEEGEMEQMLDWEDPRLLLPDSDPWASWRLEDIFPVPGRNQKSNAETQTPQPASHLGPINGTPFAWCVRCVKRIGKEGHEPCSRSNSYEECRYCQRRGKLCVSVPVPLRGDVTKLLLLTPDRQPAAVAAFARKANAYHQTVGNSPDTQKLVVMQSLNRNIFRLVNAMCAASGQPVFPDEEEQVWPEVHGGVIDGKEKREGGPETHEDVVDGIEDWYFE